MELTKEAFAEGEIRKAKGLTPAIPEAEQRDRMRRVRELMSEEGFDGLLIYGNASPAPDWIRYLANYVQPFPVSGAFLFIDGQGRETLLVDCPWNLAEAKKMSSIPDVRGLPHGRYRWQFDQVRGLFAELFSRDSLRRGKIGICAQEMSSFYYQALKDAVPDAHLDDAAGIWSRMVGSPSEFDKAMVRRAAEIADAGMRTAIEGCGEGVPENEACIEALRVMSSLGAEFLHGGGTSTHINIGSGSEVVSNVRPFLFTTRKMEKGDMFWLDLSVCYGGYYVDFDRTVCIGEPTSDQRRVYDACRAMYEALLRAIRPGVTGAEVFRAGFEVARETGHEDRFNLIYLGHMSGVTTSDRPFLIAEETLEIPEGGFINIEPGIFDLEVGTSSLEDIILVGPEGGEPVTRCDLALHIR